jgi:hypothetical protein
MFRTPCHATRPETITSASCRPAMVKVWQIRSGTDSLFARLALEERHRVRDVFLTIILAHPTRGHASNVGLWDFSLDNAGSRSYGAWCRRVLNRRRGTTKSRVLLTRLPCVPGSKKAKCHLRSRYGHVRIFLFGFCCGHMRLQRWKLDYELRKTAMTLLARGYTSK